MTKKNPHVIIIFLVIIIVGLFAYFLYFEEGPESTKNPSSHSILIDQKADNYGHFVFNADNAYFTTRDENVKNIIATYLSNPHKRRNPTLAEKYGSTVIPYYTNDVFIVGARNAPLHAEVNNYHMNSMKTGNPISQCGIYPEAGFHKTDDLLVSVTLKDIGSPNSTEGICLYERGDSNFQFIDLSDNLKKNEALFNDPAGQELNAKITELNIQNKTFSVSVYDKTKKNSEGNYAYKQSLKVSYK